MNKVQSEVETPYLPSPSILLDENATIRAALEILERRHAPGEALTSPDDTRNYLRLKLADLPEEVFGCVWLDNRHRVISVEEIFAGTIDGASVHPRVLVRKAIGHNAAAAVLFHNHPSGVAEPSQADMRITTRLKEALALVDVKVLDHFIVSAIESVSFAERGML